MAASLGLDRPSVVPFPAPPVLPLLRRRVRGWQQGLVARLRLFYALGVDQVWFALAVALGLLLAALLLGGGASGPVPTPVPPPAPTVLPLIL